MKVRKSLIVLDIETTTSAEVVIKDDQPPICSISAMAIDYSTFEIIETFNQLILFNQKRADPIILKLINYDQERWKTEGVYPLEAFNLFKEFLLKYSWVHRVSRSGRDYNVVLPVGHNIAHFDLPVLVQWGRAIRKHFGIKAYLPLGYQPRIDTLDMAQLWGLRAGKFPYSYRLPDLCSLYKLDVGQHHNAEDDVLMAYELFKYFSPLVREANKNEIFKVLFPH